MVSQTPNIIHVGQVLKVTGSVADRTYTVQSGDTLWDIAQSQLGDGARFRDYCNEWTFIRYYLPRSSATVAIKEVEVWERQIYL